MIYIHPDILDGTVVRAGEENESRIRLAWDETYLYLFAEVLDDVLSVPNRGAQIFRNDAVNLNISVLGADGSVSEEADEDDHQLTLSPLDPAAAIAESAHYIVGGRTVSIAFADVIAIPGADAGYVLEARIRWSEIGVFDPQPGEQFGLLLTVFDNDGEQVDGETLQSEIKANVAADGGPLDSTFFRSPRSWGTLTLEG